MGRTAGLAGQDGSAARPGTGSDLSHTEDWHFCPLAGLLSCFPKTRLSNSLLSLSLLCSCPGERIAQYRTQWTIRQVADKPSPLLPTLNMGRLHQGCQPWHRSSSSPRQGLSQPQVAACRGELGAEQLFMLTSSATGVMYWFAPPSTVRFLSLICNQNLWTSPATLT